MATKTELATTWMEKLAADNSHGYDQTNRWGPDYDCSSAVITAWERAGVKVKTAGATYTGNMRSIFLKNGFKDVSFYVDRSTMSGLRRGDVLLNEKHHVAMYCGGGYEVEASINEKGTARGGETGDQTGREILKRNYRNYPWDCVLRYAGETTDDIAREVIAGSWGNGSARKTALTESGYDYNVVQRRVNEILKA
jgi:cell wall-associated NlpC family hydrolase